jgi:hypothetical protein
MTVILTLPWAPQISQGLQFTFSREGIPGTTFCRGRNPGNRTAGSLCLNGCCMTARFFQFILWHNATEYSIVKYLFFPRSLSLDLLTFRKLRSPQGNFAPRHLRNCGGGWERTDVETVPSLSNGQAGKWGSYLQGGFRRINIGILKGGWPVFLTQRQHLPVSGYKQQALYISLLGKSDVINFVPIG